MQEMHRERLHTPVVTVSHADLNKKPDTHCPIAAILLYLSLFFHCQSAFSTFQYQVATWQYLFVELQYERRNI
jgi:hypothetical protein